MPRDTGNQLVTFVRDRIGSSLRTTAVLYEEGCELIYLRDDLQEQYDPAEYERVTDSFRTDIDAGGQGTESAPVGEKQALVHAHEEAFVFQFPHVDCHSILMSVEPDVGSRLRSFLDACQQRL